MLLDLSYLSYPLPPDIQRLYEAGDFARMDRVIRLRLDDPRVPEALKARLRVQTELAYEILRAYPYTQAQMLEILQSHVKDFEEEELETLRDDGTLDWRYVNGEVRFKNNALSGLLKTRAEYAARATDPEVKNGIVSEDGELYYYVDGVKTYAGLIQIDGDYYYVNSSCKVVTTPHYWVNRSNGLLPAGFYDFGADGKMVR